MLCDDPDPIVAEFIDWCKSSMSLNLQEGKILWSPLWQWSVTRRLSLCSILNIFVLKLTASWPLRVRLTLCVGKPISAYIYLLLLFFFCKFKVLMLTIPLWKCLILVLFNLSLHPLLLVDTGYLILNIGLSRNWKMYLLLILLFGVFKWILQTALQIVWLSSGIIKIYSLLDPCYHCQ